VNILNKSRGQPTWGGPPNGSLGTVLIPPHRKKLLCYETFTIASDLGQMAALVKAVMNIHFP